MIISHMPCHLVVASHHCQVCAIGCPGLQNDWQLHYHTAVSVLTSRCSFIKQHICIKIGMVLAIIGRWLEGNWFSTWKRCMWIRISDREIDHFETLSCRSFTRSGGWCSRDRWRRQWSQLWSRGWSLQSASVGRRITCWFASPAALPMVCSGILGRKASGHVVLKKHSRVSSNRRVHHSMPRVLITSVHAFWDLGVWFFDWILSFLYCVAQKPFFGHFGPVQGLEQVRLLQLYRTCLPCHRSRDVQYIPEICCCFEQCDAAINPTICPSLGSSIVNTACLVHSQGCLSGNLSVKMPEVTASWCSISQTVRPNFSVNYGWFLSRAATN